MPSSKPGVCIKLLVKCVIEIRIPSLIKVFGHLPAICFPLFLNNDFAKIIAAVRGAAMFRHSINLPNIT